MTTACSASGCSTARTASSATSGGIAPTPSPPAETARAAYFSIWGESSAAGSWLVDERDNRAKPGRTPPAGLSNVTADEFNRTVFTLGPSRRNVVRLIAPVTGHATDVSIGRP